MSKPVGMWFMLRVHLVPESVPDCATQPPEVGVTLAVTGVTPEYEIPPTLVRAIWIDWVAVEIYFGVLFALVVVVLAGMVMVKVAPPRVVGMVLLVGDGTVRDGVRGRVELEPPEHAEMITIISERASRRIFMW